MGGATSDAKARKKLCEREELDERTPVNSGDRGNRGGILDSTVGIMQ